jgi:hypothetical protein
MQHTPRSTGPPAVPRRTTVFVDGLNFHYGVARRFGRRWVDPVALCRRVLDPKWHDIRQVRFYTSLFVAGGPGGGDPSAQNAYHHALAQDDRFMLRLGKFRFRRETVRLAVDQGVEPNFALAIGMREKRSDVNLAAELVHLAHLRAFESAVVVSNDSDLTTALEIVNHELGIPIGVVNPQPSRQLQDLLDASTFARTIRRTDVMSSILPDVIQTAIGPVTRPLDW